MTKVNRNLFGFKQCLCGQLYAPELDCWKCHEEAGVSPWHMIICPKCGNKRCPKATDHNRLCTGSNEPGQDGSCY